MNPVDRIGAPDRIRRWSCSDVSVALVARVADGGAMPAATSTGHHVYKLIPMRVAFDEAEGATVDLTAAEGAIYAATAAEEDGAHNAKEGDYVIARPIGDRLAFATGGAAAVAVRVRVAGHMTITSGFILPAGNPAGNPPLFGPGTPDGTRFHVRIILGHTTGTGPGAVTTYDYAAGPGDADCLFDGDCTDATTAGDAATFTTRGVVDVDLDRTGPVLVRVTDASAPTDRDGDVIMEENTYTAYSASELPTAPATTADPTPNDWGVLYTWKQVSLQFLDSLTWVCVTSESHKLASINGSGTFRVVSSATVFTPRHLEYDFDVDISAAPVYFRHPTLDHAAWAGRFFIGTYTITAGGYLPPTYTYDPAFISTMPTSVGFCDDVWVDKCIPPTVTVNLSATGTAPDGTTHDFTDRWGAYADGSATVTYRSTSTISGVTHYSYDNGLSDALAVSLNWAPKEYKTPGSAGFVPYDQGTGQVGISGGQTFGMMWDACSGGRPSSGTLWVLFGAGAGKYYNVGTWTVPG